MTKLCDHKSVGILVFRRGQLLLIERKKPPYGYAPPAGHRDERKSFKAAAICELREEVGLEVIELSLVAKGRRNNPCRRPGGSWHYWKIFRTKAVGDVLPAKAEVKSVSWVNNSQLHRLAMKTKMYRDGKITGEEWKKNPGLEPVWADWLTKIGLLKKGD